ncbi:MAG: recombinase family protein [Chloroflexota bacterium]|nr:recombinase family protein [Chloroflexota bacterium]
MIFKSELPGKNSQRAVIYARVSSKEQDKEGFSIPAQLKLLDDYAKNMGLIIAREFVDVETAKQAGRSNFGEMVMFFKQNPTCRILLVEKTDRLYRNLKDWVTLDDLDLEIHFVKENVVLTGDSRSSEKFMHGIKVLMAKNYIDNLSEETRKGMTEKAEQGIWPSRAPLGYRNVEGSNGKRTIIPDPDSGYIITRMFEQYSTGNHSIKEIARMARRDGLAFRKSKDPVNIATVHKILRNRIYTGDFDWNGKTYRGNYTPLVTHELWERVQHVLDRRHLKKTRRVKHDFAFSGLLTCGHCGCSLVGEIKKGRYVYYHCTGYKGKCPEPYIREEVLETHFTELLKGLSFDEQIMDWIAKALRESHKDEKHYHDEAIIHLQIEYMKLQDRIDAMYIDKLDGRIDNTFFDHKAAEWRANQDRMLRDIEQHQKANQTYIDEGIRILELARSASALFEKQEPCEKRRLLNFVLSNCSWKDGRLEATYRQPFDIIAKSAVIQKEKATAGVASGAVFEKWLPE